MNRSIRLIIFILVFSCSSVWASKANVVQFGAVRVQLSLEAAPAVSRTGGTSGAYGAGGVSFINKRWLVVHVSFVPGVVAMRKMAKNAGNQKSIQGLNGCVSVLHFRVPMPGKAMLYTVFWRAKQLFGHSGLTADAIRQLCSFHRNCLTDTPPQLPAVAGRWR